MPTIAKCDNCEREGGYTSDPDSGFCERCLRSKSPEKKNEEEIENEEEDDDEIT